MITSSINEKYYQSSFFRNDIFRKFEAQFSACFINNINPSNDLYVEQSTDEYSRFLDVFLNSRCSDIKFFIGYTGVGKTTFLKHYFGYRTMGFSKYGENAVVIPASWNGRRISDNNFEKEIKTQASNILDNLISFLYTNYENLIINESKEIIEYICSTRSDVITSLTIQEIIQAQQLHVSIEQAKLQKSKEQSQVEFSSSLLKYVIEKHCNNINQLIFIVDDLETLAQYKLCSLITTYLSIYDCLHNAKNAPVVNLLISLRPHSFRFLKNNIEHKYINIYGNFLENDNSRIIKNSIPDVKEILLIRFKNVFATTEKPGNPETWRIAKNTFFEIISSLDDNMIKTVTDICHLNIRAIIDCLHMILCNRVWCQGNSDYCEHPTVRATDYRFDIVNVVRTLACGENCVYTGENDIQFNSQNTSSVLARPRFDDSDVFIPNILIDIETKECDILPVLIMQYLECYFSSKSSTPPQTEFISRKVLRDNIIAIFGDFILKDKLDKTIDYLFKNRIIRKSIISSDTDLTINTLLDDDYIYLTLKGSRFLSMFESDSVLLEIFREDIKRNYSRDKLIYKSSFELVAENNRKALFEDLIKLIEEIFYIEDSYQNHTINRETQRFYTTNFPISNRLLTGVEKSISRSQNIDINNKNDLFSQIEQLKKTIDQRISEKTDDFE